jgi:hypothetical protein
MYFYATISIGDLGGIKYLMTSLPCLLTDLGYSIEEAQLMTVIPYSISCLTILLVGYSSSRLSEHGFHHALFLCIGLLGLIFMIILEDRGVLVMFISICIACCGTFSALSILWSWFANNVGGNTKRTVAVGMMSGIGQIGAIIQPQVINRLLSDKGIHPTEGEGEHLFRSNICRNVYKYPSKGYDDKSWNGCAFVMMLGNLLKI